MNFGDVNFYNLHDTVYTLSLEILLIKAESILFFFYFLCQKRYVSSSKFFHSQSITLFVLSFFYSMVVSQLNSVEESELI